MKLNNFLTPLSSTKIDQTKINGIKQNNTESISKNKFDSIAIKHLANRLAEVQVVQSPQPDNDLTKPVEIDFTKDFPNKAKSEITQQDVLQLMHNKLADKAGLSKESKENYLKEWQPPIDARLLDGKDDKTLLSDEDFSKLKDSGKMTLAVGKQNIDSLNNYKADDLIAKYTDKTVWIDSDEDSEWFNGKRDYPINEAGLGKELSTQNADVIEKVLSKLSPADKIQVGKAILDSMSEEQKTNLSQTEKGKNILQNLNLQIAEQKLKTAQVQSVSNEVALDKVSQTDLEADPRFKSSLENTRWNEYDETIKNEVDFYNNKFKDTPNFKPLDWHAVKAMLWTENLQGPTLGNAQGQWEKYPLQIGRFTADAGASVIKNGQENSDLVTSQDFRKEVQTDITGKNNVRAGIAYLYTRGLEANSVEVIDDSNVQTYKIQPKDTIDSVAKRVGTTRENILKNSNLNINSTLSLGQEVKYQKAHTEKQISGWKDWKTTINNYNGGGDPNYLQKTGRAYQIILSREQK
jgi:LysM repeat protein